MLAISELLGPVKVGRPKFLRYRGRGCIEQRQCSHPAALGLNPGSVQPRFFRDFIYWLVCGQQRSNQRISHLQCGKDLSKELQKSLLDIFGQHYKLVQQKKHSTLSVRMKNFKPKRLQVQFTVKHILKQTLRKESVANKLASAPKENQDWWKKKFEFGSNLPDFN